MNGKQMHISFIASADWYPDTAISATTSSDANRSELADVPVRCTYPDSGLARFGPAHSAIPTTNPSTAHQSKPADISGWRSDRHSDSSAYRASYPTISTTYPGASYKPNVAFLPIG
jgi:hypothetical protein